MREIPKITGTTLGDQARVLLVQMKGFGATSDDDKAAGYDQAEAVQPLGLTSRPVASDNLEAITLEHGEELLVVAMVDKGIPTKLGDSPSLDEGETRLHGASKDNVSAMIRIKANGDMILVPKSGQKIYIGGDSSTQPMPLGNDLNGWLKNTVKTMINSIVQDLQLVGPHTHTCSGSVSGASYSGTTAPSSTITSIGGEGTAGDPPSLSSVCENK